MEVRVGDRIQWECGGMLMFDPLPRVRWISDCRRYVFVEGTNTGIPVAQIVEIERQGRRYTSSW